MPTRRLALLGLPLLAAACAQRDPMAGLSAADRTALASDGPRQRGVQEMLARARQAPGAQGAPASTGTAPQVEPLVLRFTGAETQPSPAQRMQLQAFADRAARAGKLLVVAQRPTNLASAGAAGLLGQRRAVAVAQLLAPRFPDVETRFDPAAPAGEVVVLPERSLPQ